MVFEDDEGFGTEGIRGDCRYPKNRWPAAWMLRVPETLKSCRENFLRKDDAVPMVALTILAPPGTRGSSSGKGYGAFLPCRLPWT